MELCVFFSIHCHGPEREKLEMLIRGDRLNIRVSDESANKRELPLVLDMCCASKGLHDSDACGITCPGTVCAVYLG